ncbi:LysR substrate-binding domain-containing protein, partial [Paraburkholderia sp. UYCP14C]|uniref:LysR substrate-binding domain-containing protein n=1 Tax=Paraburkholderia sp. UYCP14C TaxID=2511130 RepID=UPI0020070ABB
FNINYSSLDHTFYPNSVSRKTGAAAPASAREVRAEPELVARPIDEAAFTRRIALIRKRGRTLPPVTESFVAMLIERLGAS